MGNMYNCLRVVRQVKTLDERNVCLLITEGERNSSPSDKTI